MILESDWHGSYSTCISCGYIHELGATTPEEIAMEENPLRQRRRQPSHGKLRL